jgi:hypothetical protein
MYEIVFQLTVGFAFLLLILHSVLEHKTKFTIAFFGGTLIFGFIRELIFAYVVRSYSFEKMPFKIFGIPPAIPIGWAFTFYLGLELTRTLIPIKKEKDCWNFIMVASFFSGIICLPIETAALNLKWWELKEFWFITDNFAPVGLMCGWWFTALLFFTGYFIIQKKLKPKNIIYPIVTITIGILIELIQTIGLYLIIFIIIGFIFLLYQLKPNIGIIIGVYYFFGFNMFFYTFPSPQNWYLVLILAIFDFLEIFYIIILQSRKESQKGN